jgi:ABC-type Fe3+ transport system permease subunit
MYSAAGEIAVTRSARTRWRLWLGVGLIWAFLGVFLVYPLCRIFYDAVSDEAAGSRWPTSASSSPITSTCAHSELRPRARTVVTSSVLGLAVAFLLVRYDFRGRSRSAIHPIPIISPPLGSARLHLHLGRAGTVNVLLTEVFDMIRPINFLWPPRGGAGGDAHSSR